MSVMSPSSQTPTKAYHVNSSQSSQRTFNLYPDLWNLCYVQCGRNAVGLITNLLSNQRCGTLARPNASVLNTAARGTRRDVNQGHHPRTIRWGQEMIE